MAKVTARGAHKVATARSPKGTRYVLRSDGAVLVAWLKGDGLSVLGHLRPSIVAQGEAAMMTAFGRFARKRDAEVTR